MMPEPVPDTAASRHLPKAAPQSSTHRTSGVEQAEREHRGPETETPITSKVLSHVTLNLVVHEKQARALQVPTP